VSNNAEHYEFPTLKSGIQLNCIWKQTVQSKDYWTTETTAN